jgi:DNA-binding response OmpR family regulator
MNNIALVIDDDEVTRTVLSLRLRQAGFEVFGESDGDSGLAAIATLHPDVVLLDWMMPRMNGLEVCEVLRATPEIARTPVILLTACEEASGVERALAAGADDYITKPISPLELMPRVNAVLGRAWRT